MAQQLKRWESPRKPGVRNEKGRGGSAKARQAQKKFRRLAQSLS